MAGIMDENALGALDRKALQKLAKTNGIKANLKSSEIIKQLIAKQLSKPPSPRARGPASQARRRPTAQGHPQPNRPAPSQSSDDEGHPEPVQDAPSSRISRTQAPPSQPSPAPPPSSVARRLAPSTTKSRRDAITRTQSQKGKSTLVQPPGSEAGSERSQSASPEPLPFERLSAISRLSRRQTPPSRESSASPPPPVASERRPLPSFQQHLSTLGQPLAGPSRAKSKAPTLGVFNESSASRAPWPQEPRNPPLRLASLSPPSPPAASPPPISNLPTFPPGTHPYSISTGIPKGFVPMSYHHPQFQASGNNAAAPGTSASASASRPRHAQIMPEPGYRSRSPTPLEEYDSLRGVPLFPEPASDYEESWTPDSSPEGRNAPDGYLQAVGAGAQPGSPSPVFALTRAIFLPPPRVFALPSRSPVFRPPSPPPRPINPVERDEDSPAAMPQRVPFGVLAIGADQDAVGEADGEEGEYDDYYDDEEEEEDDGLAPATEEQLRGMVARLAVLAREQCAAQTTLDGFVEETERMRAEAPLLRRQLQQERAGFERMRAFLAHVNPHLAPEWDHDAIWDTARLLREDDHGNQIEVETSDEEEEAWKRDHPMPPNARATEIQMQRWTPWFPGVCEDEDRDNIRDIAEATEKYRAEHRMMDTMRARARGAATSHRGESAVPRTPKRRRNDDDDGRAKKRVRGSAGRTPPPQAFFRKGKKKGGKARAGERVKTPPLVGITEEDSGEEDMEMTSVV